MGDEDDGADYGWEVTESSFERAERGDVSGWDADREITEGDFGKWSISEGFW